MCMKIMENPRKKTKILAVGDIHGDIGLVKRLAERAKKENVDLVILAGDLTFFENSTKNLIGPFLKVNKEVLLIPGNHDSEETIQMLSEVYPNVKNLHGYSIKKGDLGVFGAGGLNINNTRETDKEVLDLLKKGYEGIKGMNKKVMITHMHHAGSKSEFSGFKGSQGIRNAIDYFKPDFLISAHIHEAGGLREKVGKTTIINVSRHPAVFEI